MVTQEKKILVVDDELGCLESFKMLLETEPYKVSVYLNGQDALDSAKSTKYDIAFIDDMMPIMGGLEVVSKLKQISPSTRIISLTAKAGWSYILSAYEHGASSYLRKPFLIEQVLSMCKDNYQGEGIASIRFKYELEKEKIEKDKNSIFYSEDNQQSKSLVINILRWFAVIPAYFIADFIGRSLINWGFSYYIPELVSDLAMGTGFSGHYIIGPYLIICRELFATYLGLSAALYTAPNRKKAAYMLVIIFWVIMLTVLASFIAIQGYSSFGIERIVRLSIELTCQIAVMVAFGYDLFIKNRIITRKQSAVVSFIAGLNDKTSHSYGYITIPLGILSRAINKAIPIMSNIVVVVEIVNENDFAANYNNDTRGYYIDKSNKQVPRIVISEKENKNIIDLCIKGFIEIYKEDYNIAGIEQDRLYEIIRKSFDNRPVNKRPFFQWLK